MHLTPEQVAAAQILGCSFQPATHADVARLTVQRRVFHIDGQPVLTTRGGFLETAGTLALLIEEGLIRQRVLAAGQATGKGRGVPDAVPPAAPPTSSDPAPAPSARATPEPPVPPMAPASPAPRPEAGTNGPTSPPTLAPGPSQRPQQPRWLTAGAVRRGRAGVHWPTRQR